MLLGGKCNYAHEKAKEITCWRLHYVRMPCTHVMHGAGLSKDAQLDFGDRLESKGRPRTCLHVVQHKENMGRIATRFKRGHGAVAAQTSV